MGFKMFNKFLVSALLSVSLVFSFASNASLIKQEILFDNFNTTEVDFQVAGEVVIDVPWNSDGEAFDFVSFDLFGVQMFNEQESIDNSAFFDFWAQYDETSLEDGLLSLSFDLTDSSYFFAFNGAADVDPQFNFFLDVFVPSPTGDIVFAGDIALGNSTVVPEPSAIFLMLVGIAGIAVRRKKV